MPPAALARARDVLQRLERYELDVFTDDIPSEPERAATAGANSALEENRALNKAASRAGRRRLAAQASLFDLANQKVVDELREVNVDDISPEDAKEFLRELRKRVL